MDHRFWFDPHRNRKILNQGVSMWKKCFALLAFLLLSYSFLSAQDISPDEQAIKNQQEILLILPGLIESSLLREADLSKKEQISNDREADLTLKESELQKKEQSISAREAELSQSEKDMQILKNSVVTLSESYKLEVQKGKWKSRGLVVLASCLAGSIIYSILK